MRRRPSGWSAADGAHLRPAVRARARLGAPSARGALPRGDVVRRVVVLPDTAGRHARAHVPGRAPQGMAARADPHSGRGGPPRRPAYRAGRGWSGGARVRPVFFASSSPIPFKIHTLAGGAALRTFPWFLLGAPIGRAGRFVPVAWLIVPCGGRMATTL